MTQLVLTDQHDALRAKDGKAISITTAAISGIAGNVDARTGNPETELQAIFDASKVAAYVNAQIRITPTSDSWRHARRPNMLTANTRRR